MKLPAELKPEQVTIVIDNREPDPPWQFPMPTVRGTLHSADYCPLGCEDHIGAERKTLSDLVACCGGERARFERELHRLRGFESKCVIVEASWADLESGDWRSRITPKSVVGSVLGWIGEGIPFILAGDRARAEIYAARFLFLAARKRYRQCRELLGQVQKKKTKLSPNAMKRETIDSFCQ